MSFDLPLLPETLVRIATKTRGTIEAPEWIVALLSPLSEGELMGLACQIPMEFREKPYICGIPNRDDLLSMIRTSRKLRLLAKTDAILATRRSVRNSPSGQTNEERRAAVNAVFDDFPPDPMWGGGNL